MISFESMRQPFWSLGSSETLRILDSSLPGLDESEVGRRRAVLGKNEIKGRRRLTRTKIFLNQFRGPLILILVVAGILTAILAEWVETAVIFLAVLVNTFLGFWQENKAENVLELLQSYIRTRVRVRRGGKEREIDAAELVPGDIIHVAQGDRVPADARILEEKNIEVDESVLTGESLPVTKSETPLPTATALISRSSMLFSGTMVLGGFADAVVTATGNGTEFGKIAALVSRGFRQPTPLQKSIGSFAKVAGALLGFMVLMLFLLGIRYGYGVFDMFLIAVSVAVSAVPEGLPVALTVILAVGVQRLAGRGGVVRRILAAETLGSTTVILTDKTGTLTQAKMKLVAARPHGIDSCESRQRLLETAMLNFDAAVENPENPPAEWRIVGRALETSFIRSAAEEGVLYNEVLDGVKIIDRKPFNSKDKYSLSESHHGGMYKAVMLGAPEVVLSFTSLSAEEKKPIVEEVNRRASAGERVVGVAMRELAHDHLKFDEIIGAKSLHFGGFFAFRDPLRPEVATSIRHIASAGVKTVIVTGDHPGTAEAVAHELGMMDGKGVVLTGDDLNYLKKDEILARLPEVAVFARVTPEQKVEIVKLYREKGEVVAMTGDGVNDAPALEAADIGVALGSGTDVTKNAADLVILDDNFQTIVAAIEEGRKILDNIRKVIVYLFANVFDELILIGGALLAGLSLPLSALQILFVNFFADSFPAIAFAFEDGVDDLGAKPRKLPRRILDRDMKFFIFITGFLSSATLFLIYFFLMRAGFPGDLVHTFIFAAFATYTLILSFALRSLEKSIISYHVFANAHLTAGALVGFLLTAAAVYIPFLQAIFGTVSLPFFWALGVGAIGFLNVLGIEFSKWILRKNFNR